jgi:hypothetical protein
MSGTDRSSHSSRQSDSRSIHHHACSNRNTAVELCEVPFDQLEASVSDSSADRSRQVSVVNALCISIEIKGLLARSIVDCGSTVRTGRRELAGYHVASDGIGTTAAKRDAVTNSGDIREDDIQIALRLVDDDGSGRIRRSVMNELSLVDEGRRVLTRSAGCAICCRGGWSARLFDASV